MKSLISFAVLAFFLLTASNAFAEGKIEKRLKIAVAKMEKKLMKEGWVKLTTKDLMALKDVTFSDDYGGAEYIDPSGTKVVVRQMSGNIFKGRREIASGGKYCHDYDGAPEHCWYLWKRGKYYLKTHIHSGVAQVEHGEPFTFQPGNTENL